MDVNTDRWADLVETEGQLASEVRADIQRDMERIVKDDYRQNGLLVGEVPDEEPVLDPTR